MAQVNLPTDASLQDIAAGINNQTASMVDAIKNRSTNLVQMAEEITEIKETLDEKSTSIVELTEKVDKAKESLDDITTNVGNTNAELIDIRVKVDGSTATSAGEAVREQVGEVKETLDDVVEAFKLSTNNKRKIRIDTSYFSSASNRVMSQPLFTSSDLITNYALSVSYIVPENYKISLYQLDSSGAYTCKWAFCKGAYSVTEGFKHIVPDTNTSIGLFVGKVDNSAMTDEDIDILQENTYLVLDDTKYCEDLIYRVKYGYRSKSIDLSTGYYYDYRQISTIGSNFNDVVPTANASSLYSNGLIDVSDYLGGYLIIRTSADFTSSHRYMGFCNNDGLITSCKEDGSSYIYDKDTSAYYMVLPIVDVKLFISTRWSPEATYDIVLFSLDVYSKDEVDSKINSLEVVLDNGYVSTSGSDSNDGLTEDSPLKTVNKALELGYKTIFLEQGVYEQTIDLTKLKGSVLKLNSRNTTGRVIFTDHDRVLSNTESLVSGYTKVYMTATDKHIDTNNRWIYQDNVSDVKTLISDNERHALERGKEYRCDDTKIRITDATELDSALQEIENASDYRFFKDESSGVLYFSRPLAISSTNPICYCKGTKLFSGLERSISIEATGIETKYMGFEISGTSNSTITDCKSSNVFGGGAFKYDRCLNAKFIRCEACNCATGLNGDGFNGHSDNTGDRYSKQTTCTMVDCWSHDNNDDGYSDHERSETTIIGGLYEYNGKAGITPSYGSHCTCYNVHSRNNFTGFLCCGDVAEAEGGKYTQLIGYGCISENNNRAGFKSGYVATGYKNSMMLYNCKSINNVTGYRSYTDTNIVKLVDCTSLNDTNKTSAVGVLVIENTTLVGD